MNELIKTDSCILTIDEDLFIYIFDMDMADMTQKQTKV